jgi:hypothetical protein
MSVMTIIWVLLAAALMVGAFCLIDWMLRKGAVPDPVAKWTRWLVAGIFILVIILYIVSVVHGGGMGGFDLNRPLFR